MLCSCIVLIFRIGKHVLQEFYTVKKFLRPLTSFHFVSRSSIGKQKCKIEIELGTMKYQLSSRLIFSKILNHEYLILMHDAGMPEASQLASAITYSICHSKSFERDYCVNTHLMYSGLIIINPWTYNKLVTCRETLSAQSK